MTSRELLRLLLKRWYFVLLGATVTLAVLWPVTHRAGVYWTQLSVHLFPPTEENFPNKLENPQYSLAALAGVLVTELNGRERPLMMASDLTTLYGEGQTRGVSVRLPNRGNQWRPMYPTATIDVQVVDSNPEAVAREAQRITADLDELLATRQESLGVVPTMRVSMIALPADASVYYIPPGSRMRAAAATAVIGMIMTGVAVYWLERFSTRRRGRAPTGPADGVGEVLLSGAGFDRNSLLEGTRSDPVQTMASSTAASSRQSQLSRRPFVIGSPNVDGPRSVNARRYEDQASSHGVEQHLMSSERHSVSGISIVCVFNDADVRRDCLDRSIDEYSGAVAVDYVPVDNTTHDFKSAGAALNHGARLAKQDVVVFVHQDVYLHSIDRIAEAAGFLEGETWGLLGANGIGLDGKSAGQMRDRVQLIGSTAESPVYVESLDEVLFMTRRDRILDHPLTEDPDLAWHAYAVEYGMRMRDMDIAVGAVNLAITHNSLTINLDRLGTAHRRIAAMYPGSLPVRTTCGTVGWREVAWRQAPVLRNHRWRLRWLKESARALRARRRLDVPVVLSDIRHELDLLTFSDESPLHIVNLDRVGGFAKYAPGPLRLSRLGQPVICWAARDTADLLRTLNGLPSSASILVPDLSIDDLGDFSVLDNEVGWIAGVQRGKTWLLGGPATRELPAKWSQRHAVPLGSRVRRLRATAVHP
jgi:Glycosyltransferase like family